MPRPRIALDVSGVGVLENYRMDVTRGIIRYARQHTQWELFYNLGDFSLLHWYERMEDLVRLGAKGVIFSYWEAKRVRKSQRLGLPMVSLTGLHPTVADTVPRVICDDVAVGRCAAAHFLARGFPHFAAYCDVEGRAWEGQRFEGFRAALAEAGHVPQRLERQSYDHPPSAARKLAAWLRRLPRPVAIFAATDTRAFHLLELCRDEGIAVPLEVAIVGVDNNPFVCESQHISLSSVVLDGDRVGFEAAGVLDGLLEGRKPYAHQTLVPPLGVVTRASSDVQAADDPALARALLHLRTHAAAALALDDVVATSGVSRSTLERRLQGRLGLTLNEALRRERLDIAKRLLLDKHLTLEEVAQRSGFRRATYLCNVFRELEGMTPRDWQRQQLG